MQFVDLTLNKNTYAITSHANYWFVTDSTQYAAKTNSYFILKILNF